MNEYKFHEIAIQRLEEAELLQAAYFLKREHEFRKEVNKIKQNLWMKKFSKHFLSKKHEEELVKKFEKVKTPQRNYRFNRNIWFPKHWIITKHENGQDTRIPTVIKKTPCQSRVRNNDVSIF